MHKQYWLYLLYFFSVQLFLYHWINIVHASAICWLQSHINKWTYGFSRYVLLKITYLVTNYLKARPIKTTNIICTFTGGKNTTCVNILKRKSPLIGLLDHVMYVSPYMLTEVLFVCFQTPIHILWMKTLHCAFFM